MVKMSVLSAWAELQVASTERTYLTDVVKPHIASLIPLWLSSLQEFARLRFEPDISSSMSTNPDDNLDVVYAALNRQTLLQVCRPELQLRPPAYPKIVLSERLAQAGRSNRQPH